MRKYYTPELNELHVGAVYHRDVQKDTEESPSNTFPVTEWDTFEKLGALLRAGRLKIKHLDQEDIESLGFELDQCTKDGCVFYSGHMMTANEWSLTFGGRRNPDNYLSVHNLKGDQWGFEGTIKNKSELQRVLKQIGYENN